MVKLMEALEDHDDVQHVWSNADIEEKEIEASLACASRSASRAAPDRSSHSGGRGGGRDPRPHGRCAVGRCPGSRVPVDLQAVARRFHPDPLSQSLPADALSSRIAAATRLEGDVLGLAVTFTIEQLAASGRFIGASRSRMASGTPRTRSRGATMRVFGIDPGLGAHRLRVRRDRRPPAPVSSCAGRSPRPARAAFAERLRRHPRGSRAGCSRIAGPTASPSRICSTPRTCAARSSSDTRAAWPCSRPSRPA